MNELLINNLKISYLDVNSHNESSLIFIHGNSHAKNTFSSQIESPLFENFRLIALDLPGHGQSDKAQEYSLPFLASVVNELISSLNLKNTILVGHSLGGHIAIHSLKDNNPAGLFLYGTPMLKNPIDFSIFLPNEKAAALSKEVSSTNEVELLLTELKYAGEDRQKARTNFLKTDPRMRTEILASVGKANYSDECSLLNQYAGKLKVLVCSGENLVNNKYIEEALCALGLSESAIKISAGHVPHIEAKDEFNSLLAAFANEVFSLKNKNLQTTREMQLNATLL